MKQLRVFKITLHYGPYGNDYAPEFYFAAVCDADARKLAEEKAKEYWDESGNGPFPPIDYTEVVRICDLDNVFGEVKK